MQVQVSSSGSAAEINYTSNKQRAGGEPEAAQTRKPCSLGPDSRLLSPAPSSTLFVLNSRSGASCPSAGFDPGIFFFLTAW